MNPGGVMAERAPPADRAVSALALARLLVGLRYRTLWNHLRGGPRVGGARLLGVLALLVPLAYVGLFATALETIGEVAGPAVQAAALALVVAGVSISSLSSKLASGEAAQGAGGESEFLLARPVSLAMLVAGRSLAAVATDLFDALFLLPALLAAVLVWDLGWRGAALAVPTSVFVQVAVTSAGQAGQILVLRLVPPRRRRFVWTMLALGSALGLAVLWMAGSTVLRDPVAAAAALAPWADLLTQPPAGLPIAPLHHWRTGDTAGSLVALTGLGAGAGAVLVTSCVLAHLSSRRGWEQAGAPWAESARTVAVGRRRGPLSLFAKDWRLLVRDRSRLVSLAALPVVFLGIQVFGSAGWDWSTATPTRVAVVAYSLAAYAATLGPIAHMEGERRAFWILRAVPVSLGRVLAWKALFWSTFVGGLCAATFVFLSLVGGEPALLPSVGPGALAVVGAIMVSWLAVALGASTADLTDERRSAVRLPTVYAFMIVAGLFNVVLVQDGPGRLRPLLLYVFCTLLAWVTGIRRAAHAFDPEVQRRRPLSPAVGGVLSVLLVTGAQATTRAAATVGAAAEARAFELVWTGVVCLLALVHVARAEHPSRRPRAMVLALALGVAGGLGLRGLADLTALPGTLAVVTLVLRALTVELVVRGAVQGGLEPGGLALRGWPHRLAVGGLSAALALALEPGALGAGAVVAATLPALSLMAGAGLAGALVTRALLLVAALVP